MSKLREFVYDLTRSEKWNEWRQRQALGPQSVLAPIGRAVKPKPATEWQRMQAKRSTRASRARRDRAASLRQR